MTSNRNQLAWWYYFWLLVALAAITPFVGASDFPDWVLWSFELVGIVGLWGYLRRRPVAHLQLWRVYFLAAVLSLIYGSVSPFFEEHRNCSRT